AMIVLPSPDTRNNLELTGRWLHSSRSHWAQLVLRCENTRLELRPVPAAPAVLAHPCLRPRPAQYGCPYGQRVGYLSPVAGAYSSLPSQQECPNQSVLLFGHHLHGRGGSRNR